VISSALFVVVLAVAAGVASRAQIAGSAMILVVLVVPYAITAAIALFGMHRRGELGALLRPRSGDLTFGAIAAALLFFVALLGRMALAPHGSAREGWLVRVYLQLGNQGMLQRHFLVIGLSVVAMAVLEEITWRGHVYGALKRRLGARKAWPLAAVLYALAQAPTIVMLRDPFAGPNPLVFLCALGCGLVWGLIAASTDRLPVAIFSHALFVWVVAFQFPLWRLA
jgi:CAAX protease family protein